MKNKIYRIKMFLLVRVRTKGNYFMFSMLWAENVENYLSIFKDYPYIFNLGHGVLPETKPETIEYIIQIIIDKN